LLYRLFPEGPMRKEKMAFRFGSKGSLSVRCAGDKAGQYFDFERQEGGGMFKLIQRELGYGKKEALEWSKEFLGMAHEMKVPKSFLRIPTNGSKESDWVSLQPSHQMPAPKLEEITHKKLHYFYNETARHAYRDESGHLLYYVLRLEDKNNSQVKITPPLSFGYWKDTKDKVDWDLKGYVADAQAKRHLYNLPDLATHPHSKVLIVEGEKTADKALEKFSKGNFICMTWPGGAGSVRKADWSPLIGREVFIWPDNDKAGLQAADDVCSELKKIGVSSLKVVESKMLRQHFPEKWDLADALPSAVSKDSLLKMIDTAVEKGINPERVLSRVSGTYKDSALNLLRANEILWRVDERMRVSLEEKFGKQSKNIEETIINETAKILLMKEGVEKSLSSDPTSNRLFNSKLAWQQMIYEAQHAKDPAHWEMGKMKEMCKEACLTDIHIFKEMGTVSLALDRVISRRMEVDAKVAPQNSVLKKELHAEIENLDKQCHKLQKEPMASEIIQKSIHHQPSIDMNL
jgi:hypothetical protein